MVVHGHVKNGVVVLDDGVCLPEGQKVTVVVNHPSPEASTLVSPERRDALLSLIGIWKTDNPPSDEEVERILEEEIRKKHG